SMLDRNGSHISTHAASIRFRCRLTNWLRKKSSSVSFFRSLPNHNGSPVSRLHTTVRNLPCFPRYNSSTPICRSGGFPPPPSPPSPDRPAIVRQRPRITAVPRKSRPRPPALNFFDQASARLPLSVG